MATGFLRDKPVRAVGVVKADDGHRPKCSGCQARDIECHYLDKKMGARAGFSPTYQCRWTSDRRYVSLLEEKIRVLEERQNSQGVRNNSRNQSSPQPEQEQLINEQRPLSPASLSDSVLDLENSGSFELLEFGRTAENKPNTRCRILVLCSQRPGIASHKRRGRSRNRSVTDHSAASIVPTAWTKR